MNRQHDNSGNDDRLNFDDRPKLAAANCVQGGGAHKSNGVNFEASGTAEGFDIVDKDAGLAKRFDVTQRLLTVGNAFYCKTLPRAQSGNSCRHRCLLFGLLFHRGNSVGPF